MLRTTTEGPGDTPEPRIFARHNGIAGRARLTVVGLRGNDVLARALEALAPGDGIQRIESSAITGNVLVLYDAGCDLPDIVVHLETAIRRPAQPASTPQPPRRAVALGWRDMLRDLLRSFRSSPPPLTPAIAKQPVPGAGRPPESLAEPWHAVDPEAVLQLWRTSPASGLCDAEAAARLQRYGANLLPRAALRPALAMLASQFVSLPILLLAGSAVLSILTGGIADAVIIGAVLAANAEIGFAFEYSADRTIASMLEISEPEARVLRNGEPKVIPAEEVVPGDVLLLRRGDGIPADARLIDARLLTVDESALTGESLPVEKDARAIRDEAPPLAERYSMVYRGTLVTGGQGTAIAVGTGEYTEIGRVQKLVAESLQPETPLQRQMGELGKQLTWGVCGVAGAVFAVGLLHGHSSIEMLRTAVSLAIAAVPEGLPTVATVCLANGMRGLLRHQVLARRLAAVEALGGVRALCFDKTGTLTWNRMSAVSVRAGGRTYSTAAGVFLDGSHPVAPLTRTELAKLVEVCALCSEAAVARNGMDWALEGSATEAALVRLALDSGVDVPALRRRLPLLYTEQRTEHRRYMTTVHRLEDGREMAALKGSPTDVLQLCNWRAWDGSVKPLRKEDRREILEANAEMARQGLRILATACRESGADAAEGYVWLGMVGLADPPRHGLRELMAEFRRAGVKPLMLTGDQRATAEAVADALAISGNGPAAAVAPGDFDRMPPDRVSAAVREASVFSRVTPSDKLKIVRALQQTGATVGMTGDGINDAPALKAADVGIAMGRGGARVARGVADLLLLEDDIASLLPAIREGRAVRENLGKAVHYIAATNMSEVFTTFGCVAAGLGQPFNPRQLLWINLLTDVFPEFALAIERPDSAVMKRPPRDSAAPVIGQSEFHRLGAQAGIMTSAAMAAYLSGLARYGAGARAGTLAFLTLTGAQLLHGWSARSPHAGVAMPPNPAMSYGIAAGFGLLVISQLAPGLGGLLGTVRVSAADAVLCAAFSLASFVANETLKAKLQETDENGESDDGNPEWVR